MHEQAIISNSKQLIFIYLIFASKVEEEKLYENTQVRPLTLRYSMKLAEFVIMIYKQIKK